MYETPKALLQEWDAGIVHVRCPYCSQLESQKFIGYEPRSWDSYCGTGRYSIEFPVNGAWELDKSAEKYINPLAYQASPPTSFERISISGSEADAVLKRPFGFEDIGARCDLRKAVYPVQTLNGEYWINKVSQLVQSIGHQLPAENNQELVSHAEKQLIAKFIDLHVWLPEEIHLDKELRREVDQINMRYWWLKSSSSVVRTLEQLEREIAVTDTSAGFDNTVLQQQIAELRRHSDVLQYEELKMRLERKQGEVKRQQNLLDLSRIQPTRGVKEATIHITSPEYTVCDDCRYFVANVNAAFGINIVLEEHYNV
ncbi:MAG: hypothetical protein GOMPHAMPRED_004767 [Gomphillus americanus]|uniref:Uncharacterized protein n=1 Tax=Gomphillus americanus TaxID=1940652 RepID=A0A8H3EGX7_9LECA|nr:MAG: hypothetical protein GOMPHAMPRED_004767 [Gomphillus americanus]